MAVVPVGSVTAERPLGLGVQGHVGWGVGLTLAQHAVADKTNAIPVVLELLRQVVLEGRVVTMARPPCSAPVKQRSAVLRALAQYTFGVLMTKHLQQSPFRGRIAGH